MAALPDESDKSGVRRSGGPRGATRAEIETFVDAFVRDPWVIPLIGPQADAHVARGEAIRRRDGGIVPTTVDDRRYSTVELVVLEQQVIERRLRERAVGQGSATTERSVRRPATSPAAARRRPSEPAGSCPHTSDRRGSPRRRVGERRQGIEHLVAVTLRRDMPAQLEATVAAMPDLAEDPALSS